MIRVLHTLPALDGGGAEKIIYDYAIRMMDEYQFDFIVHTDYNGMLEEDLEKRGCNIYHVPPLHKNKEEYKSKINEIISNGKYDIIHVSQGYRGIYFLLVAKKYGVPVRIAHSHMAFIPESFIESIKRRLVTVVTKRCATDLFACGEVAGKWMWGKSFNENNVFIMKNAIDVSKFLFSESARKKIRTEFKIDDNSFVVGSIARFSYQKNHDFLIKVFNEIKKRIPESRLMLVGQGELLDEVKTQVKTLNLTDSVVFTGVRADAYDIYNGFDVFLLPSRYEGLGIVLIEAQANGLVCTTSTTTPEAVNVNGSVTFLPLNESPSYWADCICKMDIIRRAVDIDKFDYDIKNSVKVLKDKYSSMLASKMLRKHNNLFDLLI